MLFYFVADFNPYFFLLFVLTLFISKHSSLYSHCCRFSNDIPNERKREIRLSRMLRIENYKLNIHESTKQLL